MTKETLIQITNIILENNPDLLNSISNLIDSKHSELHLITDGSFAGEREVLESFINKLNIQEGFVVDIAASDGFTQSSTLGLFSRPGWGGLAVEMDPVKFSKLAKLYSNFKGCKLARNRVTPKNIIPLFDAYEVPKEFSALNLDIDSYDLHVIDSLLRGDYRPALISMEINEKIPSGIFFTVNYDENHFWQGDHFYGCSLDAACLIVKKYGYQLIHLEFNNAFFLRNDLGFSLNSDLPSDFAYKKGYVERENRTLLFPWNYNVDYWLMLDKKDAYNEISKFFNNYNGKYTLHLLN